MNKVFSIILGVLFFGIIAILCLFSCILSSIADDYWEEVKHDLEKKDE